MIRRSVGKSRARERAEEVFKRYRDLGGKLPVDIKKILSYHSLALVESRAGSDLAGMLLVDEKNAIVVVNTRGPDARQRFTMAHELGHYLLHHENGASVFHRDARSATGQLRVEIDANTFAAELLMPATEVRRLAADSEVALLDDEAVEKMSREFGVSVQAMSIRLNQLGILTLDAYW